MEKNGKINMHISRLTKRKQRYRCLRLRWHILNVKSQFFFWQKKFFFEKKWKIFEKFPKKSGKNAKKTREKEVDLNGTRTQLAADKMSGNSRRLRKIVQILKIMTAAPIPCAVKTQIQNTGFLCKRKEKANRRSSRLCSRNFQFLFLKPNRRSNILSG